MDRTYYLKFLGGAMLPEGEKAWNMDSIRKKWCAGRKMEERSIENKKVVSLLKFQFSL